MAPEAEGKNRPEKKKKKKKGNRIKYPSGGKKEHTELSSSPSRKVDPRGGGTNGSRQALVNPPQGASNIKKERREAFPFEYSTFPVKQKISQKKKPPSLLVREVYSR